LVPFQPPFAEGQSGCEKVTLTQALRSQDGGPNEIQMGLGVAVIVEKTAPGEPDVPAGQRAFFRIDDVEIQFVPRPRNGDVMV
jgi:hypothetical protein